MADRYYYLDENGEPQPTTDALLAAAAWDDPRRAVAQDDVNGFLVSTVFLPLNHRRGNGPPLIFETMVFADSGEGPDVACIRASTRAEALENHRQLVEEYRQNGIA